MLLTSMLWNYIYFFGLYVNEFEFGISQCSKPVLSFVHLHMCVCWTFTEVSCWTFTKYVTILIQNTDLNTNQWKDNF